MDLLPILQHAGLQDYSVRPVSGGDTNRAFCLTKANEKYFLKINEAKRYPDMFEKEARALRHLHGKTALCIPQVVRVGEQDGTQYLVLEYLEADSKGSSWRELGEGLAALHRHTRDSFGWEEDNYIGSLQQSNTAASNWTDFYAEQRILPLIKQLRDSKQLAAGEILLAERLCSRLHLLFPVEAPSLLHGDLWSGNVMLASKGPAIFDPALYYGHREMDLGMSLLFGGFEPAFYSAYESVWPLQKGWRERVPLTQLYPLLVHACLFGGHYAGSAVAAMRRFA